MSSENRKTPRVRQLRLVVEAEDYEAAVTFYRDVLGLE
jgi:catechol 2,3-dioxygenase-like lactoylglutathione lyase family enzyme